MKQSACLHVAVSLVPHPHVRVVDHAREMFYKTMYGFCLLDPAWRYVLPPLMFRPGKGAGGRRFGVKTIVFFVFVCCRAEMMTPPESFAGSNFLQFFSLSHECFGFVVGQSFVK